MRTLLSNWKSKQSFSKPTIIVFRLLDTIIIFISLSISWLGVLIFNFSTGSIMMLNVHMAMQTPRSTTYSTIGGLGKSRENLRFQFTISPYKIKQKSQKWYFINFSGDVCTSEARFSLFHYFSANFRANLLGAKIFLAAN